LSERSDEAGAVLPLERKEAVRKCRGKELSKYNCPFKIVIPFDMSFSGPNCLMK